ncbi:hypothetical protein CCR75_002151 [Bremia lactucae]|uniref:3-deoxy-8-phosphooctulonate synthase n=1 Tax=Bremia lactucae TaxID=4779 RepID=A0A976FH63_BRELC|nr:hypothetical protein CCR75_002151 [Bremia lactucae]
MSPVPVHVSQKDLPRVVAVVVLGFCIVMFLVLQMDNFFAADDHVENFSFPKVGAFVALYTAMMVLSRFYEHGTYVLYEMLWGCNISLVLVVMALYFSKPFLVGVAMVTVSGDQLLWYLDFFSYIFCGKFIMGVMTYLTYPENRSISKTVFATHHLWFLPLLLMAVRIQITCGHGGMHGSSFVGSSILTTFLAIFCRAFTPFQARVPGSEHVVYLNVNGCYEFWKDIDIPLLHLFDQQHPALYLPFLAIAGNLVANVQNNHVSECIHLAYHKNDSQLIMRRRALVKTLRQASPFFLIAGPCVLEAEEVVMAIATRLATIQKTLQIPVIFKASFDKANRQDLASFRGPGLKRGLEMLQQVKDETGLPVLTDVHETHQVAPVAEVADIIQIPAFLSRQTDLLVAAANSGRLVNLKKGQMLSADTMLLAAQKIAITQGDAERGSMFGYGDLVVDARNLPKLRRSNGLVVQDVTHSIQRSIGAHAKATTSGGDREFISTIARMAAAVGVDGFFFETHLNPKNARCDAATMLPIDELEPLLNELLAIARASKALL